MQLLKHGYLVKQHAFSLYYFHLGLPSLNGYYSAAFFFLFAKYMKKISDSFDLKKKVIVLNIAYFFKQVEVEDDRTFLSAASL